MKRCKPTLSDVMDFIAPHLDDQRDRCSMQATCTALRIAGIGSKSVNQTVITRLESDEEESSFLLWLGPRAHGVHHLKCGK